MYADANKYFQNEPEHIYIQEDEQGIYGNHKKLKRKLIEECDSNPYPGRWYWIGMKNFIYICEKYSYVIVNNDLDIDKSNPITLFKKQL